MPAVLLCVTMQQQQSHVLLCTVLSKHKLTTAQRAALQPFALHFSSVYHAATAAV